MIGDVTAGFLVLDVGAEFAGDGGVVAAICCDDLLNFVGELVGIVIDGSFDLGTDEREVKHAVVFVASEAKIFLNDFHESLGTAFNAADAAMAIKLALDFFGRNGNAELAREFDGISVFFGFA